MAINYNDDFVLEDTVDTTTDDDGLEVKTYYWREVRTGNLYPVISMNYPDCGDTANISALPDRWIIERMIDVILTPQFGNTQPHLIVAQKTLNQTDFDYEFLRTFQASPDEDEVITLRFEKYYEEEVSHPSDEVKFFALYVWPILYDFLNRDFISEGQLILSKRNFFQDFLFIHRGEDESSYWRIISESIQRIAIESLNCLVCIVASTGGGIEFHLIEDPKPSHLALEKLVGGLKLSAGC